jgi:SAM-dependent methyltransferase
MSILVQTSPFLGQVVLHNGEVHVIDKLLGKFELFCHKGVSLGFVKVDISTQCNMTKHIALFASDGTHIKSLVISEDRFTKGNLGCQIWLSSVAFMIWSHNLWYKNLKKNEANMIGKVLELGCGVGLCGIHMASMNSTSSVIMTDGFKSLENVVSVNIRQNLLQSSVIFKALAWDEDRTDDNNLDENSFDTIVATDCIYTTNIEPLIKTMFRYLAENGQIYILNTAPDYRSGVKEFLEKLQTLDNTKTEVQDFTLKYDGLFDAKFIAIKICMSF